MTLAVLDNQDQFVKQSLYARYNYLADVICETSDRFDLESHELELIGIERQLAAMGEEI